MVLSLSFRCGKILFSFFRFSAVGYVLFFVKNSKRLSNVLFVSLVFVYF